MGKYDIFISYSSKDEMAFEVCEQLEKGNVKCWIAPRNIVAGVPYARAIMQGLTESETVIVLISKNSLQSEDVLNEIDNAHGLKKNIIPVFIEKIDLTPEFSYYLKRKQWINAFTGLSGVVEEIFQAIGKSESSSIESNADTSKQNSPTLYDVYLTDVGEHVLAATAGLRDCFGGSLKVAKALVDEHRSKKLLLATTDDKNEIDKIKAVFRERSVEVECSKSTATIPFKINLESHEGSTKAGKNETSGSFASSKVASSGSAVSIDEIKQWYQTGKNYYNGTGVEKNYEKAMQWYRKAADQGYATAQYLMGHMYKNGQGEPLNYTEAVKWYRKAAEKGLGSAQLAMGFMYYHGYGVTQSYTESISWYRKAATNGNITAQKTLGNLYDSGDCIKEDKEEAAKWYKMAAEQGDKTAQFELGLLYKTLGNKEEALKWFSMAAKQGDESSRFHILEIETHNSKLKNVAKRFFSKFTK